MFNFTKNVTLAVVFLSHLIVVRINYLISSYLDKFLSTNNTPPNKFLGIDHIWHPSRGGRGFVTFWFLLYFWSKSISFFSDKGDDEGSNLFIVRVTSYVNNLFNEKNTQNEKCNPPHLTLRLQISTLQLGGRECNTWVITVWLMISWLTFPYLPLFLKTIYINCN